MFGIDIGPSSGETQGAAQEAGLSESLDQYLRTNYGEQQATWSTIANQLNPIAAAGPNQTGFSQPELAALNTTAVNTAGGNYANAARAVGTGMSAGTGGASSEGDVLSGINAQVKGALAGQAAGQLAGAENSITQANYAQGLQNWQNAMSGLGGLAQQESPEGYIEGANNANSQAFSEAQSNQQEKAAQFNDIIGSAAALGGMAMGGFGNLDTTGQSTFGEQIQNFLTGAGGKNTPHGGW